MLGPRHRAETRLPLKPQYGASAPFCVRYET